jgi:anti-sigma factor RsiW
MIPDFDTSEHFELLSAYLDGELSPEETTKIQSLLQTDQSLQQEYQQLLKLKEKIRQLRPVNPCFSPEQLSQGVFAKVEQRRKKHKWLWGGSAIAAVSVAALTSLFPPNTGFIPQLANSEDHELKLVLAVNQISRQQLNDNLDDGLMIKLNEPPVSIPR